MKAETVRVIYDHNFATLQVSTREGDRPREALDWLMVDLTDQQLANLIRDAGQALSSRMNQGFA